MRRASARASGISSLSATTLRISPQAWAWAASKRSPSMISSRARCSPTRRGSSSVTPPVTKTPSESSGKKKRVPSAAMAKSQLMTHSSPPPTAQPRMAPMTGLSPSTIARVTSWMRSI